MWLFLTIIWAFNIAMWLSGIIKATKLKASILTLCHHYAWFLLAIGFYCLCLYKVWIGAE